MTYPKHIGERPDDPVAEAVLNQHHIPPLDVTQTQHRRSPKEINKLIEAIKRRKKN